MMVVMVMMVMITIDVVIIGIIITTKCFQAKVVSEIIRKTLGIRREVIFSSSLKYIYMDFQM